MAESSTNSPKNFFHLRPTLSNEHLVFAETLRDWRDPLLHGHEPLPVLLCPRCARCKCESLKDLRNTASHHIHEPSCPNFHHSHDRTRTPHKQATMIKSKRRAISHDPSISLLNTSSSSSSVVLSKSAEHSPLTNSFKQKKSTSKIPVRISTSTSDYSPSSSSINLNRSVNKPTKIPRLILPTTDDLYETDSLNEDAYETPTTMSDHEDILSKNQQLNSMDEQILMKKKLKKGRHRCKEGRPSKSKTRSNDLSLSTSSSSSSSSSLSIAPLQKKSRSHQVSSSSQVHSSLSDDSLSGKRPSRPRSTYIPTNYSTPPASVYLLQLPKEITTTKSSGLTKSDTHTWENENDESNHYPRYSIEQVLPDLDGPKRSIPISSRNIILERGQTDYWENCEVSPDAIITSSCGNSTGSASHLLPSSPDLKPSKTDRNSQGHLISITTTKRLQPSFLNQSKNIQWNIDSDGQQLRYSKIKWHSDDHSAPKHLTDSPTVTASSSDTKNRSIVPPEIEEVVEDIPMEIDSKQIDALVPEQSQFDSPSKQISYASTDEDVDELNSHYSDVLDRSNSTVQNLPEKFNLRLFDEQNESNRNLILCSRLLSTEYSQITFDSGVDINSEQKMYQPNRTLTIDEQSSEEEEEEEETTDQNDLFALSDDSLIDMQSKSPRDPIVFNQNDLSNSTNQSEPETYFSATSELNAEKDLYGGYELETISDDENDDRHSVKNNATELIVIPDSSSTPAPASSIPPRFEFKLPTFGEWIDRVFTTFLTETNQTQPPSIASSRSSSIMSIHGSQSTINTSSSSQVITVLENQNLPEWSRKEEQEDDEHSLNDMSSSSLNCDEKIDFDTYIINSNYEKINPSITNEPKEILFINERSKSLLSSITSSIETVDQDVRNNEHMQNDNKQIEYQYPSNSHDSLLQSDSHHFNPTTSSTDDLTQTNQILSSTFHSKDSALGLSDDNLNQTQSNELILEEHESISSLTTLEDKIIDSSEIPINTDTYIDDDSTEKMNEHERTISSSSSEQLIPKEKQTGMYYKAFGSSAALHLAEQYRCEWLEELPTSIPVEIDDNHLRILHQCQILGDNEDEFYFSPQMLHPSYSCPNLYSNEKNLSLQQHSYSLTTLDAYTHLNITQETLEQIWLSLLDVAFSDKDDYELGEYKLRHIIGLSNSYSNINQTLIEKSRSHNDIFSLIHKNNTSQSITKIKSKSFDITSLIKHSSSITNDSANIGLLQGADISEPFADRLISTSMHSDLDSIPSLEPEQISPPPPPVLKEPIDYVFNFPLEITTDEFDFDLDDKPLNLSISFDTDDLPPPILPIHDTYTELALFRPHSLSTIPSSRASQYASSVASDDIFERERQLTKDNSDEIYHVSDDDHGMIGSDFSSPQSRPLSSIQSRPLSPDQNQIFHLMKTRNFQEIDHDAWERAIDEPMLYNNHQEEISLHDEYSHHLTSIIPLESTDLQNTYLIDQIEPILLGNQNPPGNFIEQIDDNRAHSTIEQDYITKESQSEIFLDPAELSHRLEQLDLSTKSSIILDPSKSISKPLHYPPIRYPPQRIDKVSDLEIVKQGNGFKIGYVDRQGIEPRVILTKRIQAGPDILERDPQIRLPYKGRRILNQNFSSVLHTNGYNTLQEDKHFQRSANEMEVPMIGTNPKHFDESDMVSIDIDGPSTMLNSICESIIITQGSVYSKSSSDQSLQTNDKVQIIDSWQDRTIINGDSTPWRSPFKPSKSSHSIKQEKSTRDIALSPISLISEHSSQTMSTSPITVDRSCQYSPPSKHDQGLQCYFDNVTTSELPGYVKCSNDSPSIRTLLTLERSADSGILVDDQHRTKSNFALQVDIKSLSSDSEDISDVTTQPIDIYENSHLNISTSEIEQEIVQLRRERAHVLDLLSLNWNRSNIWVELTEAKLNYIIGETDALLRSLSFDPSPIDNETIKLKMHQYEEDMAELTRQHLAVYRERLEDSKRQLDLKIDQLEMRKSSIENRTFDHLSTFEQIPRLLSAKHSKSFLSTSADNLTITPLDDTITSHPQLLDISFLTTTKQSDQRVNSQETVYRPIPRYSTKTLANMEDLSQSQQAIIDETDELIKDSQQLHTESASQFERARESLLSSETSIRIARANMAASRSSDRQNYLSKDVTLAELFKYEQSLAKEAAKSYRHIYSTTEF